MCACAQESHPERLTAQAEVDASTWGSVATIAPVGSRPQLAAEVIADGAATVRLVGPNGGLVESKMIAAAGEGVCFHLEAAWLSQYSLQAKATLGTVTVTAVTAVAP